MATIASMVEQKTTLQREKEDLQVSQNVEEQL